MVYADKFLTFLSKTWHCKYFLTYRLQNSFASYVVSLQFYRSTATLLSPILRSLRLIRGNQPLTRPAQKRGYETSFYFWNILRFGIPT